MSEKSLSASSNRRIKDISESVIKIPPQDLDLEETILGAILLERPAFSKVSGFLKSSHFYSHANEEIYQAVVDLTAQGQPIDMRTVRSQLTKTGKIEIIGGAYRLAEITSKVSSSANIESHARIIIELALKRELIQFASKIHQFGFDDTKDVFDLLNSSIGELQAIQNNQSTTENKIQSVWEEIVIDNEPPPDIPVFSIGNEVMASLENHSLLIGKKKSRKTLFIIQLIIWAVRQEHVTPEEVMVFDTEQGRHHVFKLREKIKRATGFYANVFYLRGRSFQERKEIIELTVRKWPVRPKLIIIDGIRDLMADINNTNESSDLITFLEKIISDNNVHIVNVLHQNKNDKNPRGHIGTELQNKVQTVIELELDQKTGLTTVKCEAARDKPFDTFAFTHGPDEMPMIVGAPTGDTIFTQVDRKKILLSIFEDGPMKYADLREEVRLEFKISKHKAEQLIREFNRNGWIAKSGKRGDPTAVYKLMLTKTGVIIEHDPVIQPEAPAELFYQNGRNEYGNTPDPDDERVPF